MDKNKIKKNLIDIGKDILIAFAVVALVMLVLFAYSGIWPPMVVVESGSMQRYDDKSVVGVIDTGDMVFVKKVNGISDVVTYVDGEATDYSKYGTYGDVIVYRPNGLSVMEDGSAVIPIIHRLVIWLELNQSRVSPTFDGIDYNNYSFDVPSLGLYNTTENIVLTNYGFWNEEVVIGLNRHNGLLKYYEYMEKVPHGGYITMGDHNVPAYDQPLSGNYEPILPEWIVGKAIGELPWFGLIKLKVTGTNPAGVPGNSWTNLIVTLAFLMFIPFAFDYFYPIVKRKIKARKRSEKKTTETAENGEIAELREAEKSDGKTGNATDIGSEEPPVPKEPNNIK